MEADYRVVMGIPTLDGEDAPPHFMVLSFAGVDQILNDPVTFSNRSFEPTLGAAFGHTVSVMDPPEHTQYRRILQQAFRPSVVQAWGADIVAPVVDELVGAFRDTGKAELVEQFARPYPFTVIYRMLGLPPDDIDTFYKLTIAQIITFPDMTNALDASAKLGRYFSAMLDERARRPGSRRGERPRDDRGRRRAAARRGRHLVPAAAHQRRRRHDVPHDDDVAHRAPDPSRAARRRA